LVIEPGSLDVLETPHADRRHRRWPLAAVTAAVVVVGAVVVGVPKLVGHVTKGEVVSIARVWAVHDRLDGAREGVLNRVLYSATPPDTVAAHAAAVAVTLQAADRTAALQRQLDQLHLWRGTAKRLRAHASAALQAEQAQLRAATGSSIGAQAAVPRGAVADQIKQVTTDLTHARNKYGVGEIAAPDQRLSAANGFLAATSHYLDDRPAVRLAVFDDETTHLLNLRTDADDENAPLTFIQQNGSTVIDGLTVLEGVHATVVPSHGQPYRLPGAWAFSGPHTGTLWVVRETKDQRQQQAAVTDLQGNLLGSWRSLPYGTVPRASTSAGLVMERVDVQVEYEGFTALSVYDPLSGQTHMLSAAGSFLGAARSVVAIGLGDARVELVTPQGRKLREVDLPNKVQFGYNVIGCCSASGFGTVSPDQRWLALATPSSTIASLTLVDLHTGGFRTITGAAAINNAGTFAWTPDSRQVFFATGSSTWPLGRYVIGAADAQYLRWAGSAEVASIAVLPGA
jgi:hypothetical protein